MAETADPGGAPRAKCPYCGCGFIPAEPGQVYCGELCERQDAIEKGRTPDG